MSMVNREICGCINQFFVVENNFVILMLYFSANSDLLSCTVVVSPSNERQSRFLVADQLQLILVEPAGKAGWGAVRFAGLLQVRY